MKVFVPSQSESKLDEALTKLYLLKHALEAGGKDKIDDMIDDIRAVLLEVKDLIKQNSSK